jgi:trimeric autotransporter adhesin
MRRFAIILGFLLILVALAGCGGHSSTPNTTNTVTQVVISPTAISLNAGDVATITANPENSSNASVIATITFNSSNTSIATATPPGANGQTGTTSALICAGVWDSNFINCNGKNASGNPISGTANITASAGGVTSSPVVVTVHPKVTSVVVDPVAGCTSSTQKQQFAAHACSSLVLPHDSSGPCAPNATEITSQVGPISWGTTDPTIGTIDSNGLVTALNPGQTGIFASISNVVSSTSNFRTCMPVVIRLHLQGDPAGSPTTSATMTQNQSLTLESDIVDENGVTTNSVSTLIVSDSPAVASGSGLSLTATSFGGAGIVAGCRPPACGNGVNIPIYSNLFQVTVNGLSPATTVYATSSFAPPSGTSPTLIPIDTSKNPPTAGTAVTLPGVPNSMVFAKNGSVAYLGTSAGLVSFTPGSTTVTVVDATILGKVLAVSPDGSTVIVSNAANDPGTGLPIQPIGPSQRIWIFNQGTSSKQTFVLPGAVAASFDSDGFRDYVVTNNGSGNIYVFSPVLSPQTINVPGNATDVVGLPSASFTYIANSAGLQAISTCNNVQQASPSTNSSTIQLVQHVENADVIVAMDSGGLDVETATVTPLTPPMAIGPATCVPGVSYSNQFLDFGLGAFTARQLLVGTNGSHIAVLPAGINKVLVAVPGGSPSVSAITLAGAGTEPLSGGMTPDGNTVWVGVAGTNTVDRIDLAGGTDANQVTTSFKKSDNSAAPPNIVTVLPK